SRGRCLTVLVMSSLWRRTSSRSFSGGRVELCDRAGKSKGTAGGAARHEQVAGSGQSPGEEFRSETSGQGRGARSHSALGLQVSGSCEVNSASGENEKTHEHIRSSTCSPIDGSGIEAAAGAYLPGVRHALRRAPHTFPAGPAAAPPAGLPPRFFLCLLPAVDQSGGQGRTGQAAGEPNGQRDQLLPAQGAAG